MITFGRTANAALNRAKLRGLERIDKDAGVVRLRFFSDIPMQSGLVLRKEAQARSFLEQDPEPTDLTPYGYLVAEVGVRPNEATVRAVAERFVYEADVVNAIGPILEAARMGSKEAVREATTLEEIETQVTGHWEAIKTLGLDQPA